MFSDRKADHDRLCPCRAEQPLVDDVFEVLTVMEARLDPAWHFRCKQMARHLKDK